MPTTAPVTSFDYTNLDLDTASFVRQQTEAIHSLIRRSAQDIFEIGRKLIEVKEKLGHGNFQPWLKAEFDWSERTAQNFMNVAQQFKSETVADLPLAATALYILAAPSTTEETRAEAIARAKKGEPITKKKATQLKRASGQQTEKTVSSKEKKTSLQPRASAAPQELEIIDAELESPLSNQQNFQLLESTPSTSTVSSLDEVQPPEQIKALPPSPPKGWWKLFGKEQKHLLFCGHPDEREFLASLPNQVGVWLSSPPTPDEWLCPPKGRVITAISYSSVYRGINLKAIRQTYEKLMEQLSSQDFDTALLAYLPDPPLLVLLEDFQLDCYIAEPDEEQCQKILSVWQKLGGEFEKIDNLESLAV